MKSKRKSLGGASGKTFSREFKQLGWCVPFGPLVSFPTAAWNLPIMGVAPAAIVYEETLQVEANTRVVD